MRQSLQHGVFCVINLRRGMFLTTVVGFFALYSVYGVSFYLSNRFHEGLFIVFAVFKIYCDDGIESSIFLKVIV